MTPAQVWVDAEAALFGGGKARQRKQRRRFRTRKCHGMIVEAEGATPQQAQRVLVGQCDEAICLPCAYGREYEY